MTDLAKKKCVPCRAGVPALSAQKSRELLRGIPGWTLAPDAKSIRRDVLMKNFMAAVDFVNRIAKTAEKEDHHPDIHLTGYRRLTLILSTHAIGGLSENDFILAAKIDKLPKKLKEE